MAHKTDPKASKRQGPPAKRPPTSLDERCLVVARTCLANVLTNIETALFEDKEYTPTCSGVGLQDDLDAIVKLLEISHRI